jgi:hypothetical protein
LSLSTFICELHANFLIASHGEFYKRVERSQHAVGRQIKPLESRAIVRRFERLQAQQREAERQAEHLFQTLLQRAFNGEL